MSRRARRHSGQFVFHVLNRAIQNTTIFNEPDDYGRFLELMATAVARFSVRTLSYCVMPNHWHLVLWPTNDDGLSPALQWLTGRHAEEWRRDRGTKGRGAVYQSRFKAIAVQDDRHLLVLCRYVERNPLRAHLVDCPEEWPWSSASPAANRSGRPEVAEWPVTRPAHWLAYLNQPEVNPWLTEVRGAIARNEHFGNTSWRENVCRQLDWRSGRGWGRPQRAAAAQDSEAEITYSD
jgi:putative transposase